MKCKKKVEKNNQPVLPQSHTCTMGLYLEACRAYFGLTLGLNLGCCGLVDLLTASVPQTAVSSHRNKAVDETAVCCEWKNNPPPRKWIRQASTHVWVWAVVWACPSTLYPPSPLPPPPTISRVESGIEERVMCVKPSMVLQYVGLRGHG